MTGPSGFARLWGATSAVLALLLAITVGSVYARGDAASPDGAAVGVAASQPWIVDVTLTEFAIEPERIEVPADTPFTLRVTNRGAIAHDLAIDGVAATPLLQSGEAVDFEVKGLAEGHYDIVCTEVGHEPSGMRATMVASSAPSSSTGSGGHGAHGGAHMTAEEMAAKHDDLSAFPAETQGRGNQPLAPVVAPDGTMVFELVASEIEWETAPGEVRPAMAFNGQVPGPRIDVDLGDRVRIELRNELSVPTALHLHGLVLPNEMDGVPGLTQPSILPGESFAYEFEVRNAGSHMYHSHFDSANQVPGGLLGAFIVHGPDEPQVDHDYVMVLNDGPLGYTLNGKGFPATEPLVVRRGERVRVRYMNEGLQIHPMHLHGMPQRVIARDGYPLDAPYTEDNVLVSPGDRVDVLIEATEPGAWAWHCHILSHAEGPEGMFGMVTAMIVE